MFDSLDVSGSIVKLKTKDGKIYEYNNDKKELKLTYDPTKQPEDSQVKSILTNFANEWMNYSDHPKYDIIKKELDMLSKNLNSQFNVDRLVKYLKNVFYIHSLEKEFNISYFDASNEILIEDIGYRIAKDDKQQPEQLTLSQKVFMEFQNNFSDKIMSEKILNAIGDRTIS